MFRHRQTRGEPRTVVDEEANPFPRVRLEKNGNQVRDYDMERDANWCWDYTLAYLLGFMIFQAVFTYLLLRGLKACERTAAGVYLYSPAEDAIVYHRTVFNSNFGGDTTIYQGPPNDAVDKAWEQLYNGIGISQIDHASAEKLPNRTSPIPGDEKHYIVGLEVFHQLHCLNHLRKLLDPDHYQLHNNLSSTELLSAKEHMYHCIDSIRQSLMCSADVSTIYWEWYPEANGGKGLTAPNARTAHVCRDFGKIQKWAAKHRLRKEWDSGRHAEGAPVGGIGRLDMKL